MKSNRTFRHMLTAIAAATSKLSWSGKAHSYEKAVFVAHTNQQISIGTRPARKGHKRLQAPNFVPGTITYFDWLVRELGYDRRLADGYMVAFQNGYKVKLPMPLVAT